MSDDEEGRRLDSLCTVRTAHTGAQFESGEVYARRGAAGTSRRRVSTLWTGESSLTGAAATRTTPRTRVDAAS